MGWARIADSCLGDVYERLVGGAAGRIEGWVGEEGSGEVLKEVVWKRFWQWWLRGRGRVGDVIGGEEEGATCTADFLLLWNSGFVLAYSKSIRKTRLPDSRIQA